MRPKTPTTGFVIAYITTPSVKVAQQIGQEMVENKFAACANILPQMQSIYSWKGEICRDQEVVLLLKTRQELFTTLMERVLALHEYECPCILALPISDGNEPYLQWISEQTTSF